jgi:DNA-binding PadR family transcriptional regulator
MVTEEPTTLGFALLGLLHQAPQSGYDLRKVFATTALANYSSSPGAIYPALERLERAKLIESRVDRAHTLRPKMVYRPTKAGTAALRRWLTREVTREDAERRMDDLMLRFAFHSILDDAGETYRFLSAFIRQVEGCLVELKRQRSLFHPEAPLHPRLALDAGIEQFAGAARWARKALRHFEADGT